MTSIASILATCTGAPGVVSETIEGPTALATDCKILNPNPTEIYATRALTPDSRIESDDESEQPRQERLLEEKVAAKVDVEVVPEQTEKWRSQVGPTQGS